MISHVMILRLHLMVNFSVMTTGKKMLKAMWLQQNLMIHLHHVAAATRVTTIKHLTCSEGTVNLAKQNLISQISQISQCSKIILIPRQ